MQGTEKMEKTVGSLPREKCSGCGGCFNICPKNAIEILTDGEGFRYPEINRSRCINCGLCISVCAGCGSHAPAHTDKPVCYAAMAENDIRENSSSGGVFGLAAKHILERNGAVVGCTFTDKFTAKHVMIRELSWLSPLCHSKYIQSDTGDIYKQVKKFLTKYPDKPLLFSGCPCQAAALRAYLKKDYPNLIIMDLICHGAASPEVFLRYLRELSEQKGSKVKNVIFRDKLVYGWTTTITVEFENGEKYYGNSSDPYLKAYVKNLLHRPSCLNCPFTSVQRQGDITVGDFWGIDNADNTMNDTRGTSLILTNSEKGKNLLAQLWDKFKKIKEMPIESALAKQGQLRRPAAVNPERDRFFQLLNHNTVAQASEMALGNRFDVGLIGAWYFPNYGTTLTYYALHTLLNELGYSVLMIDKPKIRANDVERRENYARSFAVKHNYRVSQVYDINDVSKLNGHCNTFMLGSDQMWTWTRCEQFGNYYFLDFAHDDKKKIVYAGSFGKEDFFAPEEGMAECAFHASRIDHVSMREDIGVEICKKRFGIDAEFVMDPIFLCDFSKYDALAALSDRKLPERPYLMTYILDPNDGKRNAIKKTADLLSLDMVNTLNGVPWMHKDNAEKLGLPVQEDVGLEDMLYFYKHADFVITDSFHGSCFAILFRKPFICIANRQRGLPRFHSLFRKLGLMDRLVYRPGEIISADDTFFHRTIDYKHVYDVIYRERERCTAWLKNALEEKKSRQPSAYDILMREIRSLRSQIKELKQEKEGERQ